MALPLFSVNPSTTGSSTCSFHAPHPLCFLLLHHQTHSFKSCRALRFRVSCKTVQVDTQEQPQRIKVAFEATRKKRKPKPSFFEQIQDKWSMKVNSPRDKFPWQKQNELVQEEKEEVEEEDEEEEVFEPKISKQEEGQKCYGVRVAEPVNQKVSFSLPNRIVYAPWAHGSKRITPQVDSEPETSQHSGAQGKNLDGFAGHSEIDTTSGAVKNEKSFERRFDSNRKLERERVGEIGIISIGVSKKEEKMISKGLNGISLNETLSGDGENDEKVENFVYSGSGSIRLPWKRESELSSEEGDKTRKRRSNTELAERMLPDHELRRLRNVSLRMLERIKVGVTGITQALVNTIHEKWKIDEVVKLKFEEPFSLNMKRTHEILEVSVGT